MTTTMMKMTMPNCGYADNCGHGGFGDDDGADGGGNDNCADDDDDVVEEEEDVGVDNIFKYKLTLIKYVIQPKKKVRGLLALSSGVYLLR